MNPQFHFSKGSLSNCFTQQIISNLILWSLLLFQTIYTIHDIYNKFKSNGAMNMNDFNLSDSEVNQYFRQMKSEGVEKQYDSNSQLQTLIQNTLHLEYQIFLSEEELKMYKIILAEKDSEVKRMKQKYNKTNSKISSLNEIFSKLCKKLLQLQDGYKKISSQNRQYTLSEQSHRNQRLSYQQKKTNLHNIYGQLQHNYANLLLQIQDYGQIEQKYHDFKYQNDQMQKHIQQLVKRQKQINNDETIDRKEHLQNQVKKMYQKIKSTQKEDQSICQQYQINRKAFTELQKSQKVINNKNVQIQNLYNRIERTKEDLKLKRWQRSQRQRQLHEISQEQTQLRRQFNAQADYRQNQKKIKQNLSHNFKIIDSEADEQITKAGQKFINHYQSCNLESQQQLDQLIHRFQKIKSKSKNIP